MSLKSWNTLLTNFQVKNHIITDLCQLTIKVDFVKKNYQRATRLVLLPLSHRWRGCPLFRLPPRLPRDLPQGTNFRRKRVLLHDLQDATKSSGNDKQTRKERSEQPAQTLRPETSRKDAGSSSCQRTSTGIITKRQYILRRTPKD